MVLLVIWYAFVVVLWTNEQMQRQVWHEYKTILKRNFEQHLVLYWLSLDDCTGFYLIEDGHSAHGGATARSCQEI